METIGLTIILILATIYVFRHIKRTLMVGENDMGCQNCQRLNIPLTQKATPTKENLSTN